MTSMSSQLMSSNVPAMAHDDPFNNTDRAMIRRSLTILRNVDPGARAEIDSLIDRIEALSKLAYDAKRNDRQTDSKSRG